VAVYLISLHEQGRSLSYLEGTISAIAFYHRQGLHPSPTTHETIGLLMRSFKRQDPGRQHVAPPMTENDLLAMQKYAKDI